MHQTTFDAATIKFEAMNSFGQRSLTRAGFSEQQDRFVGVAGDKLNPVDQIVVFGVSRLDPTLQLVAMFTRQLVKSLLQGVVSA